MTPRRDAIPRGEDSSRGITRGRLGEVLAQTQDPLVGRTLDELNLVEDAAVDGHRADVRIRALVGDEGYQKAIRDTVETTVRQLPGVHELHLQLVPMTDDARASLALKLRSGKHRPGSLGSGTRVYAVGSGKGGVGKSSLTANLAVALAQAGQRIGLLDADVWGYSVPQLFGLQLAPVAVKGTMLPLAGHGVRLMSIGFFVSEEQPIMWRGPMLHKAMEQLLDDVCWGELDVLLVDLPPGTGDVPLTILQLLPDAALLLVTTPQQAATTVAARIGRMALDSRMPLAGVVENMTGSVFGAGGGARLAATLDTTLLGQIPLDEQLRQAGDDGVPLLAHHPNAPAAASIQHLAERLPTTRRSLVGRQLPLTVS